MKTLILAAVAATATLIGGAAMAQPYGYTHSSDRGAYDRGAYSYGGYDNRVRMADRDHDGIPDRWDRYDNRRDHRYHRDWRYDRYERAHRW
ncbi:hypothetical protein [Phenylobacterium sp.]|uniref:hypothetical protein n=1 Tax=Phenylobacterium sp. TaxID=1871053 RepID=UPI003563378D